MANTRVSRTTDVLSERERRASSLPASDAPPLEEPLAGYIFVCNNETMEDDLKRELFALPQKYHDSVRNIRPGMPVFLYNYTVHQLHGVFEACSEGGLNIEPNATKFPCQVRVRMKDKRPPLDESKFRPFLFHYDGPKFRLELSQSETSNLLRLFGAGGQGLAQANVQEDGDEGDWETVKPKSKGGARPQHNNGAFGFRNKRGSPPGQNWRAQPGPAGATATGPGGKAAANAASGSSGTPPALAPSKKTDGNAGAPGAWARGPQAGDSDTWSKSSSSGMVSPDLSTTGTSSEDRSTGGDQEPLMPDCNGNHDDSRSGVDSDVGSSTGPDGDADSASRSGDGAEVGTSSGGDAGGAGRGEAKAGEGDAAKEPKGQSRPTASAWGSMRSSSVSFAAVLRGRSEDQAAAAAASATKGRSPGSVADAASSISSSTEASGAEVKSTTASGADASTGPAMGTSAPNTSATNAAVSSTGDSTDRNAEASKLGAAESSAGGSAAGAADSEEGWITVSASSREKNGGRSVPNGAGRGRTVAGETAEDAAKGPRGTARKSVDSPAQLRPRGRGAQGHDEAETASTKGVGRKLVMDSTADSSAAGSVLGGPTAKAPAPAESGSPAKAEAVEVKPRRPAWQGNDAAILRKLADPDPVPPRSASPGLAAGGLAPGMTALPGKTERVAASSKAERGGDTGTSGAVAAGTAADSTVAKGGAPMAQRGPQGAASAVIVTRPGGRAQGPPGPSRQQLQQPAHQAARQGQKQGQAKEKLQQPGEDSLAKGSAAAASTLGSSALGASLPAQSARVGPGGYRQGNMRGRGRGPQDMSGRVNMGHYRAGQRAQGVMEPVPASGTPMVYPGAPGPYAPMYPPVFHGGAAAPPAMGAPQGPYLIPLVGPLSGYPSFPTPPPALLANAAALHSEILEYAEEARPTREARLSAQRAVTWVQDSVKELWGSDAAVEVFGSYATGLALPHSDVDVAVVNAPPPPIDSAEVKNLSGARISAPLIRQLAAFLQKQPWCDSLYTIETARIPVIKLQCNAAYDPSAVITPTESGDSAAADSEASEVPKRSMSPMPVPTAGMIGPVQREIVKMDITIALSRPKDFAVVDDATKLLATKLDLAAAVHNGAPAREFVMERLRQYPALAPLVLLMKSYLHHRGLKDVYTGGLGSFSLTMMLVFYLERAPVSCGGPGVFSTSFDPNSAPFTPFAPQVQTPASSNLVGVAKSADATSADSNPSQPAPSPAEETQEKGHDEGATASSSQTALESQASDGGSASESSKNAAPLTQSSAESKAGTHGETPKDSEEKAAEGPKVPVAKGVVVDDVLAPASAVPVPNLGVLLLGFLHLFGQEIDLSKVKLVLKDPTATPAALWVDDPLKFGSNIGSGSFAMWHVQAAMREMLSILASPPMSPRSPKPPAPGSKADEEGAAAAAVSSEGGERERERPVFPFLDAAFMLKLPVSSAAPPAAVAPRA